MLTGRIDEINDLKRELPGWAGLLDGLVSKLNRLDVDMQVLQVKEKFGGLRFYVQGADVGTRQRHYIDAAETASSLLCCLCGAGVTHQGEGNWIRLFCAEHDTQDLRALWQRQREGETT